MNMSLDDQQSATDFKSDVAMPNIWAIDEDENAAKHDAVQSDGDGSVISGDMEEELQKPSFLRRLRLRHKDNEEQ